MTSPKSLRPLILAWLAAVLFLCVLYFDGLRTWFISDDFAWLSLLRRTDSFASLLHSLFEPAAQGTMRFLSERAFFLMFERVFGFYNLPWRIAVFLTAAGDIALIMWLCFQATRSRLAAGIAPFFWVGNAALATVMAWDSAYNEVLCAFFLLAALALFDKYLTTGRQSFWWWQMVVFTLGFGTLEINTVYPALAAAWILTVRRDRGKLVSVVPAAAMSVGYFFLHRAVAPFLHDGPYAFRVDWRIFQTLAVYWKWSLVSEYWEQLGHSRRLGIAIELVESAVLLGLFIRAWLQGRREVLFFAAWFLLTLGPMLPLPNHLYDYYLTIPGIGLALFAGKAAADAVNSGTKGTAIAAILAATWLIIMTPVAHIHVRSWLEDSRSAKAVVLGADSAQRTHPDQTIVIDGVTDSVWNTVFAHVAFFPLDLPHPVYLTPGTGDRLHTTLHIERIAALELPREVMRNAITHSEVVVYSLNGDHMRNITDRYARSVMAQPLPGTPRWVDVGSPLFAYLLDSQWFPIEDHARWMPRQATLKLAAPEADEGLVLDGYYLLQHSDDVEHLSVAIDGFPVGSATINKNDPNGRFHRLFNLPPALFDKSRVGKSSVKVEFSVDPVLHGADGSARGLIFGTVALKK